MEGKHYFAFISHSTKDEKIALWLRNKLVNYNIPVSVQKEYNAPKRIRPVFVYQTDLTGNVLDDALKKELNDSQYLIIICSPFGAKSKYVNSEVKHFIEMGKADKIIPFIVKGRPYSENPDDECFPPALIELAANGMELRGISLEEQTKQLGSKMGAVVNVVATMLGVRFDTLWNWHQRKTKKKRTIVAILALLGVLLAGVTLLSLKHLKEQGGNNQIINVCEQASGLVDQGNSDLANRLLQTVVDQKTSDPKCINKLNFLIRKANQNRTVAWRANESFTNSALFSPDGSKIVSTSVDGSLSIWDANTHELVATAFHQGPNTLKYAVNYATFSPDMRYVISSSEDKTMILWDASTLEKIHTFNGHDTEVLSAVFNHGQSLIASAASDGTIKIWETGTYNEIKTLRHHKAVNSVVFSQDDQYLVSASDDSTIMIWDAHTFEKIQTLKGCAAEIDKVSISPDNRLIASSGEDGILRIWETATGKCLSSIQSWGGIFYSVEFSPDGQRILSTIISMGESWIAIYDTNTSRLIRQLRITTHGTANASYSPDGQYVVVSVFDKSGRVVLWDISDGCDYNALIGHRNDIYSVYYSHDGQYVVSASEDSTVRIWDANTLTEIQRLESFDNAVLSAAFSPNDQHILTLTPDFKSQMWEVSSGAEIPNYALTFLDWSNAMSQDGLYVVDPQGNLVDTKTRKSIELEPQGLMSACISHDGNVVAATTMASEGRAITLWNKSGRVIGRLTQDDVMVNFAFSHNDHYLAATSFGGYVRVWDLSTMGLEAVYEISKAPGLCAVEFSPDDSKIIYSNDSVVEMIEFSSLNELFKQACERFKDRPLTLDERRAFYLE